MSNPLENNGGHTARKGLELTRVLEKHVANRSKGARVGQNRSKGTKVFESGGELLERGLEFFVETVGKPLERD